MTMATSVTSGISRYPWRMNRGTNFGRSSLAIPFKPSRLASRCTVIKIPVKYKSAGKMARMAISLYWTPTISAIRKAAAPMIGGMICPPVEAAASTAPANSPL